MLKIVCTRHMKFDTDMPIAQVGEGGYKYRWGQYGRMFYIIEAPDARMFTLFTEMRAKPTIQG